MIKYSKQREAIKRQVSNRKDHPTADTIYAEMREKFPNISLATVYRNLNQLAEWGEINVIRDRGMTRFDPNTDSHSHFFCKKCGRVLDVFIDETDILKSAQDDFDGVIERCSTNYYGICQECKTNN